jgi:hypothetical protein
VQYTCPIGTLFVELGKADKSTFLAKDLVRKTQRVALFANVFAGSRSREGIDPLLFCEELQNSTLSFFNYNHLFRQTVLPRTTIFVGCR